MFDSAAPSVGARLDASAGAGGADARSYRDRGKRLSDCRRARPVA
ncbi:hypothetical protein [Lysobacter gummosus]